MALLDSEIARCRYELGYNVLTIGAEPYIGTSQVFELVIQPNLLAGAQTTSATAIPAAAALASPVTLTLASAAGFSAGDRVVVDVDSRQEAATVQTVSGSTITLLLANAHSGTYPVTVERGESIVRDILKQLRNVANKLSDSLQQVGISKVDEIEFFDSPNGVRREIQRLQAHWRNELSSALGVINLRTYRASSEIAVY